MRLKLVNRAGLLAIMAVWPMVAASCISDEAARYYGAEKYPPKPSKDVEVLRKEPAKPYDVIADFQARGATVDDMRKKAAAIGADAVIVSTLGGVRATNDEWASDNTFGGTYSRISGTAIRYKK